MNELEIAYNDYLNQFSLLSIDEKRKESILEIKKIVSTLQEFAKLLGIDTKLLLSEKMTIIDNQNASTDEYLNGMFAYINSLQILIGQCLDSVLQIQQDQLDSQNT